jgi:SNF2 family DNA or RNA helicase
MELKLLDYQKTSVDFVKKTPYCILALEMGLGKTIVALQAANELKTKTLIICPAYIALNWQSEISKFFPDKVVSLLRHKKDFYFPVDSDFVIITYSFLPDADILFEWAETVILEEAHYLKSMNAKRTEAAHRLIYENSISRVIMLTGTPILNRVYELHSLMCIIQYDPRIVDSVFLKRFPTFVDFANHFSNLEEYEIWRGKKKVKVQNWKGTRNLEELKAMLANYLIRYKSSDVLDLPDYQDHFIQVDNQDWPELLQAFDKFRGDEDNDSVLPQIKAKAALAKAPMTAEYVKSLLEQGLQVIVYSDHIEASKEIARLLGTTHIDGSCSVAVRNREANMFQKGDKELVVATIGAFSTGINLQRGHNMVFNDLPWSVGILEQAKFRIIRVGQQSRCQFHYMMGSFQDTYIYEKLMDKKEVIGDVIG